MPVISQVSATVSITMAQLQRRLVEGASAPAAERRILVILDGRVSEIDDWIPCDPSSPDEAGEQIGLSKGGQNRSCKKCNSY